MKEQLEGGETLEGRAGRRGDSDEGKQAKVRRSRKEGGNPGNGDAVRNQMRKKTEIKGEITRGKERKEAEGSRNPAAEMGNKSEGSAEGRHPAKARLACWEGNSQAEPPPLQRSPGSSERYLQSNKTVFPF